MAQQPTPDEWRTQWNAVYPECVKNAKLSMPEFQQSEVDIYCRCTTTGVLESLAGAIRGNKGRKLTEAEKRAIDNIGTQCKLTHIDKLGPRDRLTANPEKTSCASAAGSCFVKQRKEPLNFHISVKKIEEFCNCYANKAADVLAVEDLRHDLTHDSQEKLKNAGTQFIAERGLK